MFSYISSHIFETLTLLVGLSYLILIIKEIRFAWVLAFLSAVGMGIMAYQKQLYMEFGLQLYYVVMAVVGWWSWGRQENENGKVITWPIKYHLMLIVGSSIVSLLMAYILGKYTDQHLPVLDCFTTVFSLSITFMVTQKVLENWLYWIVINSLNVVLMWKSDLNGMALLMLIYTLMAVQGYCTWRKKWKAEHGTI